MALHRFVEVVVAEADGRFHYHLSSPLSEKKLEPGCRLLVPFGYRSSVAYFIREVAEPLVKETKAVSAILDEGLPTSLFHLLLWISDYYFAPLGKVIKAALPQITAPSGPKRRLMTLTRTADELSSLIESLKLRAPQQAHIVETLLKAGGSILWSTFEKRYRAPMLRLMEKGVIRQVEENPLEEGRPSLYGETRVKERIVLNAAQKTAADQMVAAVVRGGFSPFLLHGVTGSGKTEVYLRVVEASHRMNKGAIVLVPEIALTAQLLSRFHHRFGNLAVFHSGLSAGERYGEWRRIREGKTLIAIGVRSAIFAPFASVGVIIVDEEHDPSYKQEEGVHYHARDVALVRGKEEGAAVVLGSATPSFESFHHGQTGKYRYIHLPERVDAKPLPTVRLVDLRDKGKNPYLTEQLTSAIGIRLARSEQTLLFINRRGFAPSLLCTDCGDRPRCTRCSVALTFHKRRHQIICHYCGFYAAPPTSCPKCMGVRLIHLGAGTEKIEEEVKAFYPKARVVRMDRDTTRRKEAHQNILSSMEQGKIDILVGTQMIAKGHDFPSVTLVGVLLADLSLNVPDFRSAERTFQLLVQVAGRAGRGERPGEVIVQTFQPDHEAIAAATTHDFLGFYEKEIIYRKECAYPPFSRLILLILSHRQEAIVADRADALATALRSSLRGIEILGPAPAPLMRLREEYRYQILIKGYGGKKTALAEIFNRWKGRDHVRLSVNVDPQGFV